MMSQHQQKTYVCSVPDCGKPGLGRCSQCKVRYCGEACQADDWPSHMRFCLPLPPLEYPDPDMAGLQIIDISNTTSSDNAVLAGSVSVELNLPAGDQHTTGTKRAGNRGQVNGSLQDQKEKSEDYYYGSYSKPNIHQTMLQDTVRTLAYRDAIYLNKHLFRDKTVLDVGCGTGILSLFAARAGAKQVFGVDNSSIAIHAKQVVIDNNLDHIITIIHGKVEEVELPVQCSQWTSLCLNGWATVFIFAARDKWPAVND